MQVQKQKSILHYPRLDTILMVEEALRKSKKELTKTQLWALLPKRMMYQTFQLILRYLEHSNKITFEGNKIIWIGSNRKLDAAVRKARRY